MSGIRPSDEWRIVLEAMLGVFVVLKLTGVIDWNWFYVLLPLLAPIILLIMLVSVHYIYKLIVKKWG